MKNNWLKLALMGSTLLSIVACSEDKEIPIQKTVIEHKKTFNIPWEKDLATAFVRAKNENKELLVMAVSEGCRWCDKMKEKTLSNPKVLKKLEKYIMVQADRETPSERNQLPEFKHVPIIFFMTPQKEVIDNLRGYFKADDFLDYLNEMED
jgi:thioredoxin-related protein